MKTLICKGLGLAVVITIMMQCAPFLGGMMTSMFGQYEALAESIVHTDENGDTILNGIGAETLLTNMGEKATTYTDTVGAKAQEVLDIAKEESEVPEEDQADFEELTVKAKAFLVELGNFFR